MLWLGKEDAERNKKNFFMKGDSGYRGDNLIIQGHERKDRKRIRRYGF